MISLLRGLSCSFVLLMGRDGYHIFQGSRGGNDTRLHCLGTIAISGFGFGSLLVSLHLVFNSRLSCF